MGANVREPVLPLQPNKSLNCIDIAAELRSKETMSTRYHIDPESFEALLTDACAVQKSGLDKQSLADLVEIQQFIASERFDFDNEMQMVVDRVLKVSKAGGVAIALLESDQLVYRVGVGNATKQIGRRVAAVLNASSSGQEILRVEDASKDKRIEADICRQFGAMSLLMLPICQNSILRGVLQLSFDDAHSFPDHEIRVYRLMAGALEDGILRRHRKAEKPQMPSSVAHACNVEGKPDQVLQSANEAVMPSVFPERVGHSMLEAHGPTNRGNDLAREQAKEPQHYPALAHRNIGQSWAVLRAATRLPVNSSSKSLLWSFWITSGAAIVLGLTLCISSVKHPSSIGHSTTPELRSNQEIARGRPSPAKQGVNSRNGLTQTVRTTPEFKHLRIRSDEVDEIAEDVTIRHFATKSTQPQLQRVVKEVNLADDVTVRYFANRAPAVFKPSLPGSGSNRKLAQP